MHLVACESAAAVEPLLAALREAGAEAVEVVGSADAGTLEPQLRERLGAARVGVRLHLAGSDAFVRCMAAAAHECGLQADEISVAADAQRPAFRVACVHCHAISEPVAANIAPCAGCGRTLFVYHHFSPRKGAYMGFQADAEVPGELPAGREGIPCP